MQMNAPAPRNPIDENRQGLIGKPIDRVDGRLKVMGLAPYAHEVQEGGTAAYGFIVEATIAKGTIVEIDTAAAERASGVLLILTHRNAPAQGAWGPLEAKDRYARASPQLASARVEYYGQAVGFVVAPASLQLSTRHLAFPQQPVFAFYAGMPIHVDGQRIGTVLVMDGKPRAGDAGPRAALADLALVVGAMLDASCASSAGNNWRRGSARPARPAATGCGRPMPRAF